ncbi:MULTISPECIES: chemotaxis protein CheW [Shewanella]|uniref:chemotaxis protein CheW n=1 Tax=Shewanella TaxID=22 RepID=UPI001673CC04|nr:MULTISPECIES: chemotaxis protein CheW [Shewanella]MBO1273027.1 chemotaxis protein CheW [Shewanella sp. 4t3-1-2LB]MCL2906303.1 chemotaxis protein CheW [Shewanella fodinae]GGZ00605.1 chemotaxis protein CheW [Shewanella fodinae]
MPKSVDETVFDYFSVLLSEPEPEKRPTATLVSAVQPKPAAVARPINKLEAVAETKPAIDKQALQRLLAQVAPVATETTHEQPVVLKSAEKVTTVKATPVADATTIAPQIVQVSTVMATKAPIAAVKPQTQAGTQPPQVITPLEQLLDDEFQVLFFNVAGLTLAVPLISLGGIVQVEHINHIIGRPRWFKGVQSYRESQLNVVDTAAWVMPEKYDEKLAQSINYQYLVVLEESNWGLACESLVNAVKIDKSQVNWRGKAGKRPWLAGVVKEQMCGILHVRALVEMLNAGLGCQDPID